MARVADICFFKQDFMKLVTTRTAVDHLVWKVVQLKRDPPNPAKTWASSNQENLMRFQVNT